MRLYNSPYKRLLFLFLCTRKAISTCLATSYCEFIMKGIPGILYNFCCIFLHFSSDSPVINNNFLSTIPLMLCPFYEMHCLIIPEFKSE